MTKEIRLNAFDMNCVGHIQHGMWTHPRDRSTEYNTIEYWPGLAHLAERGKFDGIFLAPHRLRRPARDETRGTLMVAWPQRHRH